jgi:hypothetical protein
VHLPVKGRSRQNTHDSKFKSECPGVIRPSASSSRQARWFLSYPRLVDPHAKPLCSTEYRRRDDGDDHEDEDEDHEDDNDDHDNDDKVFT